MIMHWEPLQDNSFHQRKLHGHPHMAAPKRIVWFGIFLVFCTVGLAAAQTPTTAGDRALLDRYCVGCHNDRTLTAGLSLQTVHLEHVAEHADDIELWEKVVWKLRTRAMPPPGRPRPTEAEYERVAASPRARDTCRSRPPRPAAPRARPTAPRGGQSRAGSPRRHGARPHAPRSGCRSTAGARASSCARRNAGPGAAVTCPADAGWLEVLARVISRPA